MSTVNRSAAAGFERGAADYERGRPSYPPVVLERLPLHAGAIIVDLAAGTGKLTRQLAATPATVIGLEPVASMRAVLVQYAPAVAAVAEWLPLRSASCDAVTVAQAFHWFDASGALTEIARVLRPGGTLLMVWNERDESVPWVAEMTSIIHAHDPGDAYERDTDSVAMVASTRLFTPVDVILVANPQEATVAMVVDRARSTSYVSAAGEAVREQVASDVRAIVAGFDEPFTLPYLTKIYSCRRA